MTKQEAIDVLQNTIVRFGRSNGKTVYAEALGMAIKALSAQPERKTGRWIDAVLPNDNGGLPVQVCDQCNTFFPLAYTGGGHHFCPNCGSYNGGGT